MSWESAAAVAEVLADKVYRAIHDRVPGSSVTIGPPNAQRSDGFVGVNVYLFALGRNGVLANQDLPSRVGGRQVRAPTAAIDLAFMLSSYGDEGKREPELLMGAVVTELHANPDITADDVERAARSSFSRAPVDGLLEQIRRGEGLRLDMHRGSFGQLYRLWTMFQVPYALTTLYEVAPVMFQADVPLEPVLPVQRVDLAVGPLPVRILEIVPQTAAPGASVVVRLDRPLGVNALVVAGTALPAPEDPSATRIAVALDLEGIPTLTTGALEVALVAPDGRRSGPPGLLQLRPSLVAATRGPATSIRGPRGSVRRVEVHVTLAVPVRAGAQATLVLSQLTSGETRPWSRAITQVVASAGAELVFEVDDPVGTCRVGITVDDLASTPSSLQLDFG